MNRDDALRVLQGLRSRLEARGVQHVALVGSLARGQSRASSDIDVLITPQEDRKLSLFDLGAVQTLLESSFPGRRVDVLVAPIRRPDIREAVTRDSVHAF